MKDANGEALSYGAKVAVAVSASFLGIGYVEKVTPKGAIVRYDYGNYKGLESFKPSRAIVLIGGVR